MYYWESITRYLGRASIKKPASGKEFDVIKFVTNPLFEFFVLMVMALGISWNVHKHEVRINGIAAEVQDLALGQQEDSCIEQCHDKQHDISEESLRDSLATARRELELVQHDLTAFEKRTVVILRPSDTPSPQWPNVIQSVPCLSVGWGSTGVNCNN